MAASVYRELRLHLPSGATAEELTQLTGRSRSAVLKSLARMSGADKSDPKAAVMVPMVREENGRWFATDANATDVAHVRGTLGRGLKSARDNAAAVSRRIGLSRRNKGSHLSTDATLDDLVRQTAEHMEAGGSVYMLGAAIMREIRWMVAAGVDPVDVASRFGLEPRAIAHIVNFEIDRGCGGPSSSYCTVPFTHDQIHQLRRASGDPDALVALAKELGIEMWLAVSIATYRTFQGLD